MPQALLEGPVGIKDDDHLIAKAVCRPGLATDRLLERLALLGLVLQLYPI